MASAVVSVKGGSTAGAGPFNLAITSTTAGSALVVLGVNFGGGSRVVSSNGTGTWTQVFDNASFFCCWKCLDAGAGTTQVTLAATGSGFSMYVFEVSGLKAAGAHWNATELIGGPGTAWVTNTATPAASAMALSAAYQGTNSTTTTDMPGYTLPTGTGVVTGNMADAANAALIAGGVKDVASGGFTSAGTWTGSLSYRTYLFSFELAPGGGGGSGGSSAMLGTAIGAC